MAAADRTADGVSVREGDPIALVDGRLIARGDSAEEALHLGLAAAGADVAGLVSVYCGDGVTADRGETLRIALAGAFPAAAVECIQTGQPVYEFIAAVEP